MTNLITNIFIQIKAHLIPIEQLIYFFTHLFTFLPIYLLSLFLNTTLFKLLFSLKICA